MINYSNYTHMEKIQEMICEIIPNNGKRSTRIKVKINIDGKEIIKECTQVNTLHECCICEMLGKKDEKGAIGRKDSVIRHIKTKHCQIKDEDEEIESKETKEQDMSIKCEACNNTYTKYTYPAHIKTKKHLLNVDRCIQLETGKDIEHHEEMCGIKFIIKETIDGYYQCSKCIYVEKQKGNVIKHYRNKHIPKDIQIARYVCKHEGCNYQTFELSHFEIHIASHNNRIPYAYKCNICNIPLKDKKEVVKHESTDKNHKKLLKEKTENGEDITNAIELHKEYIEFARMKSSNLSSDTTVLSKKERIKAIKDNEENVMTKKEYQEDIIKKHYKEGNEVGGKEYLNELLEEHKIIKLKERKQAEKLSGKSDDKEIAFKLLKRFVNENEENRPKELKTYKEDDERLNKNMIELTREINVYKDKKDIIVRNYKKYLIKLAEAEEHNKMCIAEKKPPNWFLPLPDMEYSEEDTKKYDSRIKEKRDEYKLIEEMRENMKKEMENKYPQWFLSYYWIQK